MNVLRISISIYQTEKLPMFFLPLVWLQVATSSPSQAMGISEQLVGPEHGAFIFFFPQMGIPQNFSNSWMLYNGQSETKMDDNKG